MKILIGLSVLQTAAIIALFALLVHDRASAVRQQDSTAGYRAASISESSSPSLSFIEEQRLRVIIREELSSQQKKPETAVARNQDSAKPDGDLKIAVHAREQRDRVGQVIESYKSVGSISDQQMQELLDDIGQLDEQSRRQAMSSLITALNTGALKGRLQ